MPPSPNTSPQSHLLDHQIDALSGGGAAGNGATPLYQRSFSHSAGMRRLAAAGNGGSTGNVMGTGGAGSGSVTPSGAAASDLLACMPAYKLKEQERWSSAALAYQEMLSSRGNSPSAGGTPSGVGVGAVAPGSGCPSAGLVHKYSAGSMGTGPCTVDVGNSLELEAIAAVHELSFCVREICVSDLLPRTPELIFVNVATLEGEPYCLELTFKGWRICSLRHDCMNGDYRRVALHTRYYETAYALMENVSPGYRQRFSEKLANKLKMLQADECAAPPSSFVAAAPIESASGASIAGSNNGRPPPARADTSLGSTASNSSSGVFAVDAMLDELVPLEVIRPAPRRIDERSRESTIELDEDEHDPTVAT